ncbi:hypothetical protein ACP70R_036714 [Stipagrostis hirtigluma subsp. patula]
MDLSKRALAQGSPRRSPQAMRPGAATEADENASPKRVVPPRAASPQRKKVLGERNDGGGVRAASSPAPPQPKPASSPPSLTGRGAGPYDPERNYTTPRPEFLRYDPERRREILLRLAREVSDDDDSSSATSGAAASEAASPSVSSAPGSDSEPELADEEEEEGEEVPARRSGWARRLFLLLFAVAFSFCIICCMDPASFPVHSEDGLDLDGPTGSMYDAGVGEVDSLRLLGPVYMMGPEDVLEVAPSQFVHGDAERNFMAVATMGLADICPNVPLGELTCQIGDEISEDVADLKEDSELDGQEPEVVLGSFQNEDQSSEVGCLGGNISCDSSGSTHTADMEESSSGLVHQDKGEDYSDQFVPQLVSMEVMESASDKLDHRKGLDIVELNIDTDVWQYENTAEAAREICSKVKKLWSATEPHLWQILACLSVAGFVTAMFKYFQRSKKIPAPASQHMTLKPPAEAPVLVPHHVAQLPLSSPTETVQLPVYSSERPVHLTVSKQDLWSSLECPMQLPLLNSEPSVSLEVPVIDHGNHDQKLQQGNAECMTASHGNFLDHRDNDSSKPPVVELLGEFTFADSSRGRSIKNSNKHALDVAVPPSSEALGKHLDQSSIGQSPSVRRARKEETAVKGQKDVTPTPLRRSNRIRNKVTSP